MLSMWQDICKGWSAGGNLNSNFMSRLLANLYHLLHIHLIQMDGEEEGKNWDKLIPYFLFAYREVPQASTRFSPFELLYGRSVRGPLDVLRKAWEGSKKAA